jgi:EAL domain-containing protein (putative c-di-GMP-specific phosphodiesterase class I)/GGDEF domain-containing protein
MICKNMSLTERFSRIIASLILMGISPLGLNLLDGAVIGWFCAVFGVVNFISALVGWCFMYSLVGFTTFIDEHNTGRSEKPLSDDLKIESLVSLKRKIFIGFSVIALLITGLYILQGYSAAIASADKAEFLTLHHNTKIIIDELKDELNDGGGSEIDQKVLEENLYHFNQPMMVILHINGQHLMVKKDLPLVNAQELTKTIHSRNDDPALRVMSEQPGSAIDSSDVRLHIAKVNGQNYVWMSHKVADDIYITTVHRVDSQVVLNEVISSLSMASLVVLWMCLWGAYGVAGFVTTRVEKSNRQMLIAATTDPITGLLNERALKSAFQQLVQMNAAAKNQPPALRFTLIYYRKYIQVQLDHGSEVANKVLQNAAELLRSQLPGDAVFGRLNDGGFLAMSHGKSLISSSFWQEANKTLSVSDYEFSLDPTAIILDYPKDGGSFDSLLKHASITLHQAFKDRNPILKFNEKFLKCSLQQSIYASQLKSALATEQFELYLQPKVCLHNHHVIGAEALIRWNHPEDGLLAPLSFLDIVEQSNARYDFSLFVIRKSAQYLQELKRQGRDIQLSFNLNAYDINDARIITALRDSIRDFDIPAGALQMELTETETSYDVESILNALGEISEMGYSIAIDDFGTGMSSLAYCHRLPIQTIKIDRSFILGIEESNRSQLLVKTIIEMANVFSWDVIAEGIENVEVARLLQTLGCEQGQGYYFGKPVPFETFCQRLNKI